MKNLTENVAEWAKRVYIEATSEAAGREIMRTVNIRQRKRRLARQAGHPDDCECDICFKWWVYQPSDADQLKDLLSTCDIWWEPSRR